MSAIKTNLVKFIEQFSFKKLLSQYKQYWLQGLALVIIALVVTTIAQFLFYYVSGGHNRHHNSFLESLHEMVDIDRSNFTDQRLSIAISFVVMLMAAFRLDKQQGLSNGLFSPKMFQSVGLGLLVTLGIILFLGHGIGWLNQVNPFGHGDHNFFVEWFNMILAFGLPPAAFYTGYLFLQRGLDQENPDRGWPAFVQVFITTLVVSWTGILLLGLAQIAIMPVVYIFGSLNTYAGLVILVLICIALLIFYLVFLSDLMLILLGKNAGEGNAAKKSNPDLLDM